MHIAVWSLSGKYRSQVIARALEHGARRAGHQVALRGDVAYREPIGDVAAFYGYQKCFPQIMADYIAAGKKVVFIDLGYWGRHAGGRYRGYHKMTVNARHPTDYIMDRKRAATRLMRFGVRAMPWKKATRNSPIVVAGMSDKSANSYGLKAEEWERWAVAEIRKHTSRKIIYRPKPSWNGSRPIAGSEYHKSIVRDANAETFARCHAVVTHHSNISIDALVHGVPSFCWDGAAVCMSSQDLSQIEKPLRPRGREQWLANLAWCQWNTEEMRNGMMWQHLESDGFIP